MKAISLILTSALVTLYVTGGTAAAATLYKCKDAKGVMSYQQTPCDSAKQTAGVQVYQVGPDRPETSWSNQLTQTKQEREERVVNGYQQTASNGSQTSPGDQADRRALLAQLDSQIAAIGTPNNASKRALLADLMAQKAQIVTNGTVQPSARPIDRHTAVARTPPAPQSVQVRDQYGNTYTRPPGSSFVTDDKTGKQCFTYGNFVDCK